MVLQLPISDTAVLGHPVSGELFVVDDCVAMLRAGIANVAFISRSGPPEGQWILVDCGILGYADAILKAAAKRFGDGSRPAAIVLTHGHFDHVGALEELAAHWDVPVLAHVEEHPFLDGRQSYPPADPLAGGGLMTLLSPLFPRRPIDVSDRLRSIPPDGSVAGLSEWQWLHTPGHTPGHVSLWNAARRVLVAGDACITTGQESAYEAIAQTPELHGPPRYFTPDWDAARNSVKRLAELPVRTLVSGHGPPLQGEDVAPRLVELAARFDEIARPKNR
jgi:glyoxylase-like metal-dependent hydrolase (beta-lactamase superfamily II)